LIVDVFKDVAGLLLLISCLEAPKCLCDLPVVLEDRSVAEVTDVWRHQIWDRLRVHPELRHVQAQARILGQVAKHL
jgi:hypothetical protein